MFLFTLYALFGEDVRLLSFTKKSDTAFMLLNIFTFVLFMVELVLSSLSVPEYFGSFFFWLDLVSTISLVADIDPIWTAITSNNQE